MINREERNAYYTLAGMVMNHKMLNYDETVPIGGLCYLLDLLKEDGEISYHTYRSIEHAIQTAGEQRIGERFDTSYDYIWPNTIDGDRMRIAWCLRRAASYDEPSKSPWTEKDREIWKRAGGK